MKSQLKKISQIIGYQFEDEALLIEALSHRSRGSRNYERLEFLGDGALNFVIATALYHNNPQLDEGALSRLRASLVRGVTLTAVARELGLGEFLLMGEGELKSGGFDRDSILADVVESLIGAVYIEAGFDEAQKLVLRLLASRLENQPDIAELKDPKTRLQERLQGSGLERPVYELLSTSGKPHQQQFTVECQVPVLSIAARATGGSRRKAEQMAATEVLRLPAIASLNG